MHDRRPRKPRPVEFSLIAPRTHVRRVEPPRVFPQRCRCGEEWSHAIRHLYCPECGSSEVYDVKRADPAERLHSLADAPKGGTRRVSTGSPELDRLLGGGAPVGGVILLAGEPGAGKTYTLVQTCHSIAERTGGNALYATGEEEVSAIQTKALEMGFDPRSAASQRVKVVRVTKLTVLLRYIATARPRVLVVDSLPAINDDLPEEERKAQALTMPRGADTVVWSLIQATKNARWGMASFIINQINAEGEARGGMSAIHAVDAAVTNTIDPTTLLRRWAVIKSRYGTLGLSAVFEKRDGRVVSVPRSTAKPTRVEAGVVAYAGGAAAEPLCFALECDVTERVEGRMAAMVQARGVAETRIEEAMGHARRHLGCDFRGRDVLVELSVGTEPAPTERGLDLALVAALVSAYSRKRPPDHCAFFGSISVKGAVEHTTGADLRARAAKRLGFVRMVCPAEDAAEVRAAGLEPVPVKHVLDLVSVFGVAREEQPSRAVGEA